MLNPIGTEIVKNHKKGGGIFIVIGHKNCSRCSEIVEEIEVQSPSVNHRKSGKYYSQYSWCEHCGLYEPVLSSKTIIK